MISIEDFTRIATAYQWPVDVEAHAVSDSPAVFKLSVSRGPDTITQYGASVAECVDAYRRQVVLVCAAVIVAAEVSAAEAEIVAAQGHLAAAQEHRAMLAPLVAG